MHSDRFWTGYRYLSEGESRRVRAAAAALRDCPRDARPLVLVWYCSDCGADTGPDSGHGVEDCGLAPTPEGSADR